MKALQSGFSSLFAFGRVHWRELTIVAVILTIIGVFIPKILHPFRCEVESVPTSFNSTDGYSIDGQVILRGTLTDIKKLLSALPDTEISLTLIEGCDLSYLNYSDNPNPQLTEAERKDLVVQLYQVKGDKTAYEVVNQINSINEKLNLKIEADPNYFVRRSDATEDPCWQPDSPGGSGGGKDFGGPGELGLSARAADAFKNQWAFVNQGITLPPSAKPELSSFTGQGVRVAVFDSSPFRTNLPFYRRIAIALPGPVWFKVRDTSASRNLLSSHGIYVAELIHSVAPKSKIDLIHVLDDRGCTRTMPLIKELNRYMFRRSFWTGGMNKHILNLSLGVAVPVPDPLNPSKAELDSLRELDTLHDTLTDAYNMGAIIVAAAGNDSPGRDKNNQIVDPMPMLAPAEFDNVIGVAAISNNGQRSCYSNFGDVAAPGGDGGPGQNANGTPNPCVPRAKTWNQPDPNGIIECNHGAENCRFGVISLVMTDTGPQYALWSGTSFATPIVSGLAALAYERWNQKIVECLIEYGANPGRLTTPPDPLGWGIIDFGKTLTDTTIQSLCQKNYP